MSPNQILVTIAATATAVTVIMVFVSKAMKLVKQFIHFLDDYFGEEERPGFAGRPGMQERLKRMEDDMKSIVYEMKPNSGSSIKDAINRIEKRLEALEEKTSK